jgi:hypothetical protein
MVRQFRMITPSHRVHVKHHALIAKVYRTGRKIPLLFSRPAVTDRLNEKNRGRDVTHGPGTALQGVYGSVDTAGCPFHGTAINHSAVKLLIFPANSKYHELATEEMDENLPAMQSSDR